MILVTGGTGSLGRHLVPLLLTSGERVRILSRNPDATVPDGCELAVGDVRDHAMLRTAAEGCTTVIAATHGVTGGRGAGPEAVDDKANVALIDAAEAAGVKRFVLMSAQGAAADSPLSLMRSKHAAEHHLTASGLEWIIVRPALNLETWLFLVVGQKVQSGGPALVLGKGENPITWVSVRDVAAVVAEALTSDASRVILDVTGPANHTLMELAAATGAAKVSHVPRPALGVMRYAARPFAPALARQAAMAYDLDTANQTAPLGQGSPTPGTTLAEVAAELRKSA
ncbi:MAG: SDR family oxidoreductase [Marmoricola sp.]